MLQFRGTREGNYAANLEEERKALAFGIRRVRSKLLRDTESLRLSWNREWEREEKRRVEEWRVEVALVVVVVA